MVQRGVATAGVLTLLLAGCTAGTPAGPANPTPSTSRSAAPTKGPAVTGKVRTNPKTPLSLRERPSTDSRRLARIPHRTTITMTCKAIGDTISNGSVASNVWNRITYKKQTGYVASVYVAGGDSQALSLCQSATAAPTATVTRPPNVEAAIVKNARKQLGTAERKNNCNPYGGCMPWNSLFATWVWNKSGDVVPAFSFSGDLYSWGQKHQRSHLGTDGIGPGDMVLYGTKPDNPKTSTRVDIVIEVLPGSKLKVIGGDIKNKVAERTVPLKGIYGWVDA